MKVLMLSRDRSGLDPASSSSARWNLLRAAGVELDVRILPADGNPLSRVLRLSKEVQGLSGYDLVTAQDPFELGWIAYRFARSHHIPWEIQDHGGFFDGQTPDEPLWFVRKFVARYLVKRATRVRTVSPSSPP